MIRILFLLLLLAIGALTAFILLGRLLGQAIRRLSKPSAGQSWNWSWHLGGGQPSEPPPPAFEGETARDPVCGMFVSTEVSHQLTERGQTLHFCSRECLERYRAKASQS